MPVSGGLSAYLSAILIFSPATPDDAERLLAPIFPLLLLQTAYFFELLHKKKDGFSSSLLLFLWAISFVYVIFRLLKNCLFFAAYSL
jgi:hypothetical protein